jgi:GNAT superfamily N-acetyltransferase
MNLEQHWTGHDGTPLTMRWVRASDRSGLDALIKSMEPRDRRWRFHGAVNALSSARLHAMTAPVSAEQLALVVVAHGPVGDTLIADARCVIDASGESAECGLMVAPAWRRLGIGARATLALREVAASAGLRWLHGSVMADNKPMLALVQRCGFLFTPNRRDASLVGIELQLQGTPPAFTKPPLLLSWSGWCQRLLQRMVKTRHRPSMKPVKWPATPERTSQNARVPSP